MANTDSVDAELREQTIDKLMELDGVNIASIRMCQQQEHEQPCDCFFARQREHYGQLADWHLAQITQARKGYVAPNRPHPGEDHYWHTSANQFNVGTAGVRLICDCGEDQVVYDQETHDQLAGGWPKLYTQAELDQKVAAAYDLGAQHELEKHNTNDTDERRERHDEELARLTNPHTPPQEQK